MTTTSTGAVSSLSGSSALQVTGLASGLDTNSIISQLMSVASQPVTQLQSQQTKLTATNAALTAIQTALRAVSADAAALQDPSLFHTTQAVSSSDPTRITATSTTGAGVGGYQVSVSQLANSAQRTFTYTAPTASDSISIDGHAYTVAAGASINDVVASINSDANGTVYAAATDSGTLVLSDRATGSNGSNFIQVTDPGGALAEQRTKAKAGQDALYSVDGVSGSSHSNLVTGAIAGVTLTLTGVTTVSGPVTVNVAAPAPSASALQSALQQFTTDYNTAISTIQTQLAQKPSSSNPTQGTLFGDPALSQLLGTMRQSMYADGSGLTAGMTNLSDLGISTGKTTGSGSPSQAALSGQLTLDQTAMTSALSSRPSDVQSLLVSFAQRFTPLVDSSAAVGGSIDARVNGDNSEISNMSRRISSMQSALTDKQAQLTQQFAALEGALSQSQSTASWLTGQINALPGFASSSTKSG